MPNDINKPTGNPEIPVPKPNPATTNEPVIPVKPVTGINPPNPAPANAIVNAQPPPSGNQVGVFTTPQSLLTFTGSTAAVTLITNVLIGLKVINGDNKGWWMLGLSFAFGLAIYIGTVSSGATWRQKILEAVVAIVNTFTIAAAVLGVNEVSARGNAGNAPAAPANNTNTTTNTRSFYKKKLADGREIAVVYRENEKSTLAVR